jgi:hypothetical protein
MEGTMNDETKPEPVDDPETFCACVMPDRDFSAAKAKSNPERSPRATLIDTDAARRLAFFGGATAIMEECDEKA